MGSGPTKSTVDEGFSGTIHSKTKGMEQEVVQGKEEAPRVRSCLLVLVEQVALSQVG